MKNLITLVLKILIMIPLTFLNCFVSEDTFAQCNFIPANKVETPVAGSNNLGGSVQNTGNDSRIAVNFTSSMTVHV